MVVFSKPTFLPIHGHLSIISNFIVTDWETPISTLKYCTQASFAQVRVTMTTLLIQIPIT